MFASPNRSAKVLDGSGAIGPRIRVVTDESGLVVHNELFAMIGASPQHGSL